jgi:hypothetical protein
MHIRMQRKRNRDCGTKVRLIITHWIRTVEAGGRAEWGAGGWPDSSGDWGQWWSGLASGGRWPDDNVGRWQWWLEVVVANGPTT